MTFARGERQQRSKGNSAPLELPFVKNNKRTSGQTAVFKKKAKIQMENDVCCLCRVHVPLGPREERVIWESCLHASTFFKIASSTPE